MLTVYQQNKYTDALGTLDRFIQLHPAHRDIAYAYYLRALSYYEQIADEIEDQAHLVGRKTLRREGRDLGRWILLDFGSAIVHVMAPPEREFYQLEQLWADATILLRVL